MNSVMDPVIYYTQMVKYYMVFQTIATIFIICLLIYLIKKSFFF
jgi:hypothetical protein